MPLPMSSHFHVVKISTQKRAYYELFVRPSTICCHPENRCFKTFSAYFSRKYLISRFSNVFTSVNDDLILDLNLLIAFRTKRPKVTMTSMCRQCDQMKTNVALNMRKSVVTVFWDICWVPKDPFYEIQINENTKNQIENHLFYFILKFLIFDFSLTLLQFAISQ